MPAQLKSNSSKLFTHSGFSPARFMFYGLVAVVLMAMDQHGSYNQKIRESLATLALPVQSLAALPASATAFVSDSFRKQRSLLADNQDLAEQLLVQKIKLMRLQVLTTENQRLRSLLDARASLREQTMVVEFLEVDLDPFSHRVVIDQGLDDGVYSGMVMLDATGVMGQVDVVTSSSAVVILISDPDHALPVQVARTGLRSIAFGTGDSAVLMLPNVSINADIKRDDLLLTSGLGQRFPAGYPVARVMSVERSAGRPFARVWALPLAQLERTKEALLLRQEAPKVDELSENIAVEAPVDSSAEVPE